MPAPSEFKNKDFKLTTFNRIEEEIRLRSDDPDSIIPLHIGDTHVDLPEELNRPLMFEPWNDRLSRYGNTQGEMELRKRLAEKIKSKNRIPVAGAEEIQITYGASGALFVAMRRLFNPSDEILTLAPYWTILRVVASSAGATLVEVPFFDRIDRLHSQDDLQELLLPYLSEKTAGIYYNNPNNPSGVMMKKAHIEQIARFAQEKDLWVLSDEAYEDFVWSNEPYLSIGSLPGMYERTVSIFTMAKSYAASGLRMGCLAAPKGVVATVNPTVVGTGYEPNRSAQVQWIRGLERFDDILPRLKSAYRRCLAAAKENLQVPYIEPEGSFYLFLDLRDKWKGRSDSEKLESMLNAGVAMSPGEAFGAEYDGWARFCFIAEPPDRIAEAARRVNLIK
ncbi:pyridoxal phosphate-dependent aminotransferase [Calditrichota bacterium]